MPYKVTVAAGVKDLVLPSGTRVQAGDVAILTDDQWNQLSPTCQDGTTVLTSVSFIDSSSNPAANISSQGIPMLAGTGWASYTNPLTEVNVGTADNVTTPYSVPNNKFFLEEG